MKPLAITTTSVHIELGLDEDGDNAYTFDVQGQHVDNITLMGALEVAKAFVAADLLRGAESDE